MPSINAKKGNRESGSRTGNFLRNPLLGLVAGMINPGLGLAVRGAQAGANLGSRVGYMFDNDPSTGFWRGQNAGQPFFQGARDFLGNMFGGGADRNYQGPPSLAAGGEPPPTTFTEDDYNRATSAGQWSFTGAPSMTGGQSFNASMPGHWRRTGTSASWGGASPNRNNQSGNSGNRLDGYMMNDRGTIQFRDAIR